MIAPFLRQAELRSRPGGLDHLPGIASGVRGVNDDRPRCSGLRGALVLVIPPAIPEAGLPGEEVWIVFGVVVHHQQDLALEISSLVIVPPLLRRDDPVTDENDLRVLDRG